MIDRVSTTMLDGVVPGVYLPLMPNSYDAPGRKKVVRMFKRGKSPREISWELGISRQRVYQQLERARQFGELPLRDDDEGVA